MASDPNRLWPGIDIPYNLVARYIGLPEERTYLEEPGTPYVDPMVPSPQESPVPEEFRPNGVNIGAPRPVTGPLPADVPQDEIEMPEMVVRNEDGTLASSVAKAPGGLQQVREPVYLSAPPAGPQGDAGGAKQEAVVATTTGSEGPVARAEGAPAGGPPGFIDVTDGQNRYRMLGDDMQGTTRDQELIELGRGEVGAQKAEAEAQVLARALSLRDQERAAQAERERAQQERLMRLSQEAEDAVEEYRRASKPPAGGDYTMAMALAAIAGDMSASAGAAMVMQTIQSRVAKRQADWENRVGAAKGRIDATAAAVKGVKDAAAGIRESSVAQEAALARDAADRIEVLGASYKAPEARLNAMKLAAEVRQKGNEGLQKLIKDVVDEEDKKEKNRIDALKKRGGGGGGGGLAGYRPPKDSPYQVYTGIDAGDGTPIYGRKKLSETEQKDLRAEVNIHQDAQLKRGELRSRLRAYGVTPSPGSKLPGKSIKDLTPTQQKEIEDLYYEMVQAEVKAISGAGSSDSERAQIQSRMPGFAAVFGGPDPISRLDAIERRSDEQWIRHANSYGVDPGAVSGFVTRDRTGRPGQDDDGDGVPNRGDDDFNRPRDVSIREVPLDAGADARRSAKDAYKTNVQKSQQEKKNEARNLKAAEEVSDRWGGKRPTGLVDMRLPDDAPPDVFAGVEQLNKDINDQIGALNRFEAATPGSPEKSKAAADLYLASENVKRSRSEFANSFDRLPESTRRQLIESDPIISKRRGLYVAGGKKLSAWVLDNSGWLKQEEKLRLLSRYGGGR